MPDADRLTPADPRDLAAALAYALRFQGRNGVRDVDEMMAEIVAKRLVDHLADAGFVIMKRPPEIGAAALGRGFDRSSVVQPDKISRAGKTKVFPARTGGQFGHFRVFTPFCVERASDYQVWLEYQSSTCRLTSSFWMP